jgi:hypothetical protein
MEIDSTFRDDGNAPRRFYMRRMVDQTGVSRTGRVLEGVLWQNGEVTVQWRPPHSTSGFYHSLEEFNLIHVDCHPSCNEIVWVDPPGFHCFACGAGGNPSYFCAMCGSGSRDFINRDEKHCRKCGNGDVRETDNFCIQCGVHKPLSIEYAFAVQDAMAQRGLTDGDVVRLIESEKEVE